MDNNLHPDLARMSISDLSVLMDIFERLAGTALSFLNEPRLRDTEAEEFTAAFYDGYCGHYRERILEALKARVPSNTVEAEERSQAIVRYWAGSDSYDELLAAVQEGKAAAERRWHLAQENRRVANGG